MNRLDRAVFHIGGYLGLAAGAIVAYELKRFGHLTSVGEVAGYVAAVGGVFMAKGSRRPSEHRAASQLSAASPWAEPPAT